LVFVVIPSAAEGSAVPMEKLYYVYMMASRSHNLYIGVTNHLQRRVEQHRAGVVEDFTRRYRIDRLVYFEIFGDVRLAIAREKQIKRWRREKKIALIEEKNPTWLELMPPKTKTG
jgi:putative endonuclease